MCGTRGKPDDMTDSAEVRPRLSRPCSGDDAGRAALCYEQPLVAPQVSHFSQVPLRTMVKFWHSEHMLPV